MLGTIVHSVLVGGRRSVPARKLERLRLRTDYQLKSCAGPREAKGGNSSVARLSTCAGRGDTQWRFCGESDGMVSADEPSQLPGEM